MRTLSSTLLAELGRTVTRPGYLVYLGFSTPLRLSTMGDVAWGGETWIGADVKVAGLSVDERGRRQGSVSLGNADIAYGALVLNEGVADRQVVIYSAWAGAPSDAIEEFRGVGDAVEIGDRVSITLAEDSTRHMFAPRRFVNSASGFSTLVPAGTKIRIGQQIITLER